VPSSSVEPGEPLDIACSTSAGVPVNPSQGDVLERSDHADTRVALQRRQEATAARTIPFARQVGPFLTNSRVCEPTIDAGR